MNSMSLWLYALWLLIFRFLLSVLFVAIELFFRVDITSPGIPVISAILAAMFTARSFARSERRPLKLWETARFAVLGMVVFYVVNWAAFLLSVLSLEFAFYGRELSMSVFVEEWLSFYSSPNLSRTLAIELILVGAAFIANGVFAPLAVKTELRAMARQSKKALKH